MKKILIVVFALCVFLTTCKKEEVYKFEKSCLTILNTEITQMPIGKIYFRAFERKTITRNYMCKFTITKGDFDEQ